MKMRYPRKILTSHSIPKIFIKLRDLTLYWFYGFRKDDFWVSDAIFLEGANSVQTSIKCRGLGCDVEPPPLKTFKDLTMKLGNWRSDNLCQLHLQELIFVFIDFLKVWEWETYKFIVLGCQRIHKPGRAFSGFSQISMELYGSKIQLAPPHRNFINDVANPEMVNGYHLDFFLTK